MSNVQAPMTISTRLKFLGSSLSTSLLCLGLAVLSGCDHKTAPPPAASGASAELASGKTPAAPASNSSALAVNTSITPAASGSAKAGISNTNEYNSNFVDLVQRLSEPDAAFFSDNIISNETSYLQVASELAARARPGSVYIGVGPEQNFTYIALTKPAYAFIVDIRRQNMLLHLIYKAAFEEAQSRVHFLALVLGRPYDASADPGASADIDAVLKATEAAKPDEASFGTAHKKLSDRIDQWGLKLDANDKKTIEVAHRAFFKGQLEIKFELHQASGRKYPTLRELLKSETKGGEKKGFLANEEAFRFVQTMQKEGRIIPLVGDFAGDRAMPGLAAHLKEKNLMVGFFYVSNVEQYLFEPGIWPKWSRNVGALPSDENTLFIRGYLDQGRTHPLQMKGHRAATILQKMADFKTRNEKKPFTNFFEVCTDNVLAEKK